MFDEPMRKTSVTLPLDLVARVDDCARAADRSRADVMREALELYLGLLVDDAGAEWLDVALEPAGDPSAGAPQWVRTLRGRLAVSDGGQGPSATAGTVANEEQVGAVRRKREGY